MIQELREEFWKNVQGARGPANDFNQSLEKAGRVADFLEFAELMVIDALARQESCGGHFNEAFQTEENEARRDDANFCHVAAWEFTGDGQEPDLHKEPLVFENVHAHPKELQVSKTIQLTLKIWRQNGPGDKGRFEDLPGQGHLHGHVLPGNARRGQRAADAGGPGAHRLRPRLPRGHLRHVRHHGQRPAPTDRCKGTTLCQLHMRHSQDGDTLVIEPFRARAFPVIKDLVVDRSALDRIIQAGGYISVNTGSAPDANTLPVPAG